MNLRLKSKLTEKHVEGTQLAKVWDVNVNTVYLKLNGKTIITCNELSKAAQAFGFSDSDVLYILFGARY